MRKKDTIDAGDIELFLSHRLPCYVEKFSDLLYIVRQDELAGISQELYNYLFTDGIE